MRNAFADEILLLARNDPRIVLLSGDIGNRLFDRFKAEMPVRFYNCGVAEANMISLAAGLAACGLRPVCYTITPFVTTRCLEQIKVDVCYHAMPVTIVGTGAGLSYASLGATHHSFEDLALLRVMPGMNVIAPADAPELSAALRWTFKQDGAAYLRIGKKGEPVLTDEKASFSAASWQCLRKNGEAVLLSCGTILGEVLEAARLLEEQGVSVALWNCASVKPLDDAALSALPPGPVITIEEHSVIGGFGSAIAEYFAGSETPRRVVRCGISDAFLHDGGEQEEARKEAGIDAEGILHTVRG